MCSPSKMFHSVSHFPCCIMFVIFSSVLHYLWHCMRYEAEPGLLMTALTSQPRTQRQEPGTLDTTSAYWSNFSDIPYMYQILYYQQGKSILERVWTISECLSSSVTPVLIFVSVCHIIATTSCCSLLARCQHSGQSVARDTLVWQHPTPAEKTKQWIRASPEFTWKS